MHRILTPQRFLMMVFGLVLMMSLLVAVVHFTANRWGVFSEDYRRFIFTAVPNRHYLKTKFILDKKHDYQCFLFGSSRVSAIDTAPLGEDCYNFTFAGGVPQHHLHILKLLTLNKINIRKVYIGLDDISYTWNPQDSVKQYLRRPYPDNTWDQLAFYLFYLFKPVKVQDLMSLGAIRAGLYNDVPELMIDPNLWVAKRRGHSEKITTEAVQQEERIQALKPSLLGEHQLVDETLTVLNDIRLLSQEHGFALEFFFNPHHYKSFLARNMAQMGRFKKGVAELQPFIDFSGVNEATVDNRYWFDPSHYSILIGDAVVQRLLGLNSGFAGFGELVDPQSVEQHLHDQYAQAASFLKPLMLKGDRFIIPEEVYAQLPVKPQLVWQDEELDPGMLRSSPNLDVSRKINGQLQLQVKKSDQYLLIRNLPLTANRYFLLRLSLHSDKKRELKIYVGIQNKLMAEQFPLHVKLVEGDNLITVPIYDKSLGNRLRLDLGVGTVLLKRIRIEELR